MKGSANVKKIHILDKITFLLVGLNIVSFLIEIAFYNMLYDGSLLYTIVSVNGFYIVFGIPLNFLIGIIINVISLAKKIKTHSKVKINIFIFIILILMIPVWKHFFWQALMGV